MVNNYSLYCILLFSGEIKSHITLGLLITTENDNYALIFFLHGIIPVCIAIILDDIIIPAQGDLHLGGGIGFGITVVDLSISKIAIEVNIASIALPTASYSLA